MILPIRDILTVEKTKGTRFGHYGLTVIIKGHEELFFEFGFDDRRQAFVSILEQQLEEVTKRPNVGDIPVLSQGEKDALTLEEFEPRSSMDSISVPRSENMSESLPAVMFTSASSTFLTFKPKESLHFTILTIGSRGDVQPYIALAKGLMEDGHRVRIATHGEFREWIEAVSCLPFFEWNIIDAADSTGSSSVVLVGIQQNLCASVLRMVHSLWHSLRKAC